MTSEDKPTQRLRAGEWLRAQRERRGFVSAAELGRAIGTTKEVIWSYEKGRASVPDERAEQIAEALEMDLIDVRRGLGLWVPREATDEELENAYDEFEPGSLVRRVEELIRRRKERQLNWALKAIEDEGDRDAG